MTVPVTALRSTIAAALANPTSWQVFSFPPASPIANSLIIQPADPYIEPTNGPQNSLSPVANFTLTLIVPMFDNQGGLTTLETFITQLFNLITASNLSLRIGSFSAPTVLPIEVGQMLSVDLPISILTNWS